ncbi:MAG: helix-turn-helix transcriptional regulator [Eubacteriaceae bacterium]|nr:helix-turn-helix transcriptional regulator [Eubacteriaceae bacterium]
MLAAKGWKNKEIADRMHISVNTVKEIMKSIYQKLDVSNRKELDKFMLK